MINPINRSRNARTIATYKVEPYVVAADVYAVAPHIGRGGWTWYTGSAGWMYRLVMETLLGLTLKQDRLHVTPRIPPAWDNFELHYRYRRSLLSFDDKQGRRWHCASLSTAMNSPIAPFR